MKEFKVSDIWGAVGVVFFLIFIYYLVTKPQAVSTIVQSVFGGFNNLVGTLKQGG